MPTFVDHRRGGGKEYQRLAGGPARKVRIGRQRSTSGRHQVDNRSTCRSTIGPHPVDMPVEKWSTRGPDAGGKNDDRNDDRRRRNDDFRRPMTTNDDLRRKKFGPTRGGARTWPESGGQTGRPADDLRTTRGRPRKSRRKPTFKNFWQGGNEKTGFPRARE